MLADDEYLQTCSFLIQIERYDYWELLFTIKTVRQARPGQSSLPATLMSLGSVCQPAHIMELLRAQQLRNDIYTPAAPGNTLLSAPAATGLLQHINVNTEAI